jgi:outer membrane protein W
VNTAKTTLALAVLLVAATVSATAQSLEKRHLIELRIGLWNQVSNVRTDVGVGGVSTSVGGSGFLGGLAYGHWLSEGLALRVSVGAMAAGVDTEIDGSGVSTETATITQLLLGMRYYFPRSTYGSSVRPFLGAGVGTFIGSQVASEVGAVVTAEARTEATIGGELGAGVDFLPGRHFVTSVALTFALMTDFEQPIGGSDNYSGPQFTIGFGYVFGGGSR